MAFFPDPQAALDDFAATFPTQALWMGRNLALAGVPLALSALLFRRARRRTWPWWVGVVIFIAFLPNAAYVLADYRWFINPLRNAWIYNPWKFGGLLPVWGTYFALGLAAWVISVRSVHLYMRREFSHWSSLLAVVALAALSAVGMYLGRADLNSWSLLTEPHEVVGPLRALTAGAGAANIAFAFAILLISYVGLVGVARRVWRARLGRGPSTCPRAEHATFG